MLDRGIPRKTTKDGGIEGHQAVHWGRLDERIPSKTTIDEAG